MAAGNRLCIGQPGGDKGPGARQKIGFDGVIGLIVCQCRVKCGNLRQGVRRIASLGHRHRPIQTLNGRFKRTMAGGS